MTAPNQYGGLRYARTTDDDGETAASRIMTAPRWRRRVPSDPGCELHFRVRPVLDCSRRRLGDKDLDRQRVVDDVAAEVRIVAVSLEALVPTPGARQNCIVTGSRRRDPVVFPAPPRGPAYRIAEVALDPRSAAVDAHPGLCSIGRPRPFGTQPLIGS